MADFSVDCQAADRAASDLSSCVLAAEGDKEIGAFASVETALRVPCNRSRNTLSSLSCCLAGFLSSCWPSSLGQLAVV